MLIFTVATVILQPLVVKIAMSNARALMGSTALVTTLIGLIITAIVSDGLKISGGTTWLLATLIVWLASMIAAIILPIFLVKEAVNKKSGGNGVTTFGA